MVREEPQGKLGDRDWPKLYAARAFKETVDTILEGEEMSSRAERVGTIRTRFTALLASLFFSGKPWYSRDMLKKRKPEVTLHGTFLICVYNDPCSPHYGMLWPMWCTRFGILSNTGDVDTILSPTLPWDVAIYHPTQTLLGI